MLTKRSNTVEWRKEHAPPVVKRTSVTNLAQRKAIAVTVAGEMSLHVENSVGVFEPQSPYRMSREKGSFTARNKVHIAVGNRLAQA